VAADDPGLNDFAADDWSRGRSWRNLALAKGEKLQLNAEALVEAAH
jgi:hypothetical protein